MSKIEKAREILRYAAEHGHKVTVEGNWVVFRPPLPTEMILAASKLGDTLADAAVEDEVVRLVRDGGES